MFVLSLRTVSLMWLFGCCQETNVLHTIVFPLTSSCTPARAQNTVASTVADNSLFCWRLGRLCTEWPKLCALTHQPPAAKTQRELEDNQSEALVQMMFWLGFEGDAANCCKTESETELASRFSEDSGHGKVLLVHVESLMSVKCYRSSTA